jgi:hypothetical protein
MNLPAKGWVTGLKQWMHDQQPSAGATGAPAAFL